MVTLPETNIAPENMVSQKETILFQPSIFRCELLVLRSVHPKFGLIPCCQFRISRCTAGAGYLEEIHIFHACLQGKMLHERWKGEQVYMRLMERLLSRGSRMYEIHWRWTELLFVWYPEWRLVLFINLDHSEVAKDFIFQSMLQLEVGMRRLLRLTLQSVHAQKLNGKINK